jgi:hypothetical protein
METDLWLQGLAVFRNRVDAQDPEVVADLRCTLGKLEVQIDALDRTASLKMARECPQAAEIERLRGLRARRDALGEILIDAAKVGGAGVCRGPTGESAVRRRGARSSRDPLKALLKRQHITADMAAAARSITAALEAASAFGEVAAAPLNAAGRAPLRSWRHRDPTIEMIEAHRRFCEWRRLLQATGPDQRAYTVTVRLLVMTRASLDAVRRELRIDWNTALADLKRGLALWWRVSAGRNVAV